MGRYVTGKGNNFEYKFIFGEQPSNFSDILTEVNGDSENYITTYFNQNVGEYVTLYLEDKQALIENIELYLTDYKPITDDEWNNWSSSKLKFGGDRCDKFMMNEFLKFLKENNSNDLTFHVEY